MNFVFIHFWCAFAVLFAKPFTQPHEAVKLQWYGQVSRSSGLAKTIMQGTVKGGRRQGGQTKRWEGNIREWTGLEFAKSQRAVEKDGSGK